MSKKKKSQNNNAESEQIIQAENEVAVETNSVQPEKADVTAQEKKTDSEKTAKDKKAKSGKNDKKGKKKEKGKLKRKAKETMSELKKVTWPTFGDVCKKTGVVLVVVLVFAVVVFGIDYCLGLLMNLLKG